MSTRSVIARKTEQGFQGVYHHWDGYPSGLGRTLYQAYNSHFGRDLDKMLVFLIDQHPAGWSTINGADWTLPAAPQAENHGPCVKCGLEQWMHYAQYYTADEGSERPVLLSILLQSMEKSKAQAVRDGRLYLLFDHDYQQPDVPHGPVPYTDEPWTVTEKNAADSGCEYAFVFTDSKTMLVLSSYSDDGGKMIGMFGYGDPKAHWDIIAEVPLDGPEPDWEAMTG